MQTIQFVHWQDGDAFLGYLLDYPDYWTQGDSLDERIIWPDTSLSCSVTPRTKRPMMTGTPPNEALQRTQPRAR